MPDQTVDNTPNIDKKISPVEKIKANLQASEQFDQQHWEWKKAKEVAQESNQDIPEEPKASPEAIRGQLLASAKEKSYTEINNLFEESLREGNKKISPEKRKETLNLALNNTLKAIKENPDQELKIMQVAGALDVIDYRVIPNKWEEISLLLDISPESLSFSKLPNNFETNYIGKFQSLGENFSDLKKDSVQNVLKHLSSEVSPLEKNAKEACQLYIMEGEGAKIFDKLNAIKDVYAAMGGHFETPNLTITDITETFGIDNKYIPKISELINKNHKFGLNNMGTINGVALLIPELIKENPELSTDLQGKLVGYDKSLLRIRPDLYSPNYKKERDGEAYTHITDVVAESLMNLYDLEKVDFLMEIIQSPDYTTSVFDKEIGLLFLENGFRIPSVNEKTGSQHLKIIEKANVAKRNQETADLEAKQAIEKIQNAEKLAIAKKDQEETIKQFLENKEIRGIVSSLVSEKGIYLNDSKLETINKTLNNIVKNNPNLESASKFAKEVALQFIRYTKDSSITTESQGTAEENFGPFNLLRRNRPATIFRVDLAKINEIKRQALASNDILFDPDNQIKVQALTFLSRRNGTHYIEN